ncbi:MAG: ankyrin repeat domain-containing protein [Synergistaceae bacterium]|nr:ankyrin repeat domain-containing protein [Synergistaceae bacterium]
MRLRFFVPVLLFCCVFLRVDTALASVTSDDFLTALAKNDMSGLKLTLLGGFDVNGVLEGTARKLTPLMEAIRQANPEIVKVLLDFGADVDKVSDGTAETPPLEYAVILSVFPSSPNISLERRGNAVEIVDMLLAHNADVNFVNLFGSMPLIAAINGLDSESSLALTKRLIAAGADVNPAMPPEKMSPLMWAVLTALITEFERGDNRTESVKTLLDAGADPNTRIDGMTALHMVVSAEREINDMLSGTGQPAGYSSHISYEITEVLLRSGADKYAKDKDGRTPFDVAMENRDLSLSTLLAVW